MKRFIIVNHGSYGSDKRLTDEGYKAMAYLAEELEEFVKGHSVIILASTYDAAIQSASTISSFFSTKHIQNTILSFEQKHEKNFDELFGVVLSNRDKGDVLIFIAHCDVIGFTRFFTKKERGSEECELLDKAEACVLEKGKPLIRVRVPDWKYFPSGERI